MSFPPQNAIKQNTPFEMWWKWHCGRNVHDCFSDAYTVCPLLGFVSRQSKYESVKMSFERVHFLDQGKVPIVEETPSNEQQQNACQYLKLTLK